MLSKQLPAPGGCDLSWQNHILNFSLHCPIYHSALPKDSSFFSIFLISLILSALLSIKLMQINGKILCLHVLLSNNSVAFSVRFFGLQVYLSYPVKQMRVRPRHSCFWVSFKNTKIFLKTLRSVENIHQTIPVTELHIIFNDIIPLGGVLYFQDYKDVYLLKDVQRGLLLTILF